MSEYMSVWEDMIRVLEGYVKVYMRVLEEYNESVGGLC